MNSFIRLSKYEPGQFFGIHKDGIHFDETNQQNMSYATLNIFLNDNFEGGETIFYKNDARTVSMVCKPKVGRGSFFYSQQYHEGAKLLSGYKYLLRTESIRKSGGGLSPSLVNQGNIHGARAPQGGHFPSQPRLSPLCPRLLF